MNFIKYNDVNNDKTAEMFITDSKNIMSWITQDRPGCLTKSWTLCQGDVIRPHLVQNKDKTNPNAWFLCKRKVWSVLFHLHNSDSSTITVFNLLMDDVSYFLIVYGLI